jgi:ArsR family transcriptional regulator
MDAELPTAKPIMTQAVVVLKALADSNRLRILDRLMQGLSCNCELNEQLGLSANLLSHHLRVLREAGLIHSRQDAADGRWIYYSVDKEAVERWRAWLGELLDPARIQERAVLCGPEGQQSIAMAGAQPGCASSPPTTQPWDSWMHDQ